MFFRSFDKSRVKDGRMTVEISVKCGIYGISVIDDENNNGKMEYNLLGIPKEGFGFSNFNLKKMRAQIQRFFIYCCRKRSKGY